MVFMLKVTILILNYDEKKSSRFHQIILKQFYIDFKSMIVNDEGINYILVEISYIKKEETPNN
jgi:hypothetical protein